MTDYTWIGNAGDGEWSSAGNWNPNGDPIGVPGDAGATSDKATIATSQYIDVAQSQSYQLDEVILDGQLAIDGDLTVNSFQVGSTSFVFCDTVLSIYKTLVNSGAVVVDLDSVLDVGSTDASTCVLAGSGDLEMRGGTIEAPYLTTTLENSASTIEGYGSFAPGDYFGQAVPLNIQNDANARIIADFATLTLDSGAITNGGLLAAEDFGVGSTSGTLLIQYDVQNSLDTLFGTSQGTIEADGQGNIVDLDDMTVTGGYLTAAAGGLIQVGDGSSANTNATLDGVTLTAGKLEVGYRHELDLATGTITDNGLIAVDGGQVDLRGDVTLAGRGRLQLSASSGDLGVMLGTAGTTLTNDVLLDGNGSVDANASVTLVNHGRIICDVARGEILVSLGGGSNANSGTLEATKGGELFLGAQETIESLGNTGFVAAMANSMLVIGDNVTLTNISHGTLTGGTWEAIGANATLRIGEAFAYDGATIVLSGAGSVVNDANGDAMESTLKGISAGGKLEVLGSRSYTTSNAFSIRGTLQLAGTGTFKAASISAAAGSLIEGSGTIGTALLDNGNILSNGGKLAFGGAVTGTGRATIETGGTLVFGAAATSVVTFATGGGRLTLQDAGQFAGLIGQLGAGDSIDVSHLGAGTTFTFAANSGHTGGTLTLTHGTTTDRLSLVGSYAASGFKLTTGQYGDTLVTYAAPSQAMAAPSRPASEGLAQSLFDAAFSAHGVPDGQLWPSATADHTLHSVLAAGHG